MTDEVRAQRVEPLDLEPIKARLVPRGLGPSVDAGDVRALIAEVERLRAERDIAAESARHHAKERGLVEFGPMYLTPGEHLMAMRWKPGGGLTIEEIRELREQGRDPY